MIKKKKPTEIEVVRAKDVHTGSVSPEIPTNLVL